MLCLVLGTFAFALLFLSDFNDWKWSAPALRFCFPAAFLLLAGGTISAVPGAAPLSGPCRWLVAAAAAGFFLLLIYTLFIALPVEASYAKPGKKRAACTTGVYALCRHPGVLWFAGLYLCLAGCTSLPAAAAVLFSALNTLLAWFEDCCVFPALLDGYAAYQNNTPFLLPSAGSIFTCFSRR